MLIRKLFKLFAVIFSIVLVCILVVMILTFIDISVAPQGDVAAFKMYLDKKIPAYMQKYGVDASVVGVIHDHQIVHLAGYGFISLFSFFRAHGFNLVGYRSIKVDPHQSPIGIKMVYAIPGSKSPRRPSVPCRFQNVFSQTSGLKPTLLRFTAWADESKTSRIRQHQ